MPSTRSGNIPYDSVPYMRLSYTTASNDSDEKLRKPSLQDLGQRCYMCGMLSVAFVFGGILATILFYWHYSPFLSRRNSLLRSQLDSEMATADQANEYLMHRNAEMAQQLKGLESSNSTLQVELLRTKKAEDSTAQKAKKLMSEEVTWHNKFEEEEAKFEALTVQDNKYKHEEQVLQDEKQAILHERDKSDKELSQIFDVEALVNAGNISTLKERVEAMLSQNSALEQDKKDLAKAGVTTAHVENLTSTVSFLKSQVHTLKKLNSELMGEDRETIDRESHLQKQVDTITAERTKLEDQVSGLQKQVAMLIQQNNLLEEVKQAD